MTGMKEGTGSDPFAEDVVDEPGADEQDEPVLEEQPAETASSEPESDVGAKPPERTRRPSKDEIPYIFRRSRVTDERTLHSFYLRDQYEQVEEDTRHGVQQRLGEQVPKADLREAMLFVAARDLDAVADELREWGYDID